MNRDEKLAGTEGTVVCAPRTNARCLRPYSGTKSNAVPCYQEMNTHAIVHSKGKGGKKKHLIK